MKTLVIIDDEIFFRKSLINFLEKQNIYNIAGEANNGQAGIQLIENVKPDIALVDISMPVMSGLDMIAALGTDCHTRFILSTGYEDFDYAKKAISLQVRGYLLKPLDHRELMETLQKVSDEIDQENSRNSYVNNYFQFRDLYTRQMQLNFFQKVISGTTISPDDLEKIPVHKTSDYLTILMEIHNANPEIWDEKGDFSLLHTILENICREILQPVCKELIYIDYSQMSSISSWKKALIFLLPIWNNPVSDLPGYMIISHRFPLFSAVEHLMKAWKESAIPMKRLFLFFITELRLLPDFFISRPSPIPVILH